jgi:adenylate kinase
MLMLNLVIFGPPGSGKGTQATHIKEKYGLLHLSTGEMLRNEIAAKTDLGQKVESFVINGQLVPDELVTEVLKKALAEKLSQGNGFIFDGFPRNGEQAQILEDALNSLNLDINIAINLTASDPELIKRILLRGKTSGRADDNEIVIKDRLEIYRNNVTNLINFYQEKGKLYEVDGEGTPQEVFERITKLIEKHL